MTARDRIVIMIVLVVAAIVGSWLLVIQPQRDRAAKLGGEVTAAQSELDAAQAKLAQARLAQSTYRTETARLARLGEAVPTDEDVPSLLYQLQSAAAGAHIDFRGLQTATTSSSSSSSTAAQPSNLPPGVTVGSSGFPTEQFTFTFQGTYLQLARFIDRVQKFVTVEGDGVSVSGRLLALNSISLAAAPSGLPQITATISASAYVMPASSGSTGDTAAGSSSGATSSPSSSSSSSSSSTPTAAAVATPLR